MLRRSLLTYAVARHNAVEMDRRGIQPGLLIRLLVMVARLATLGLVGAFLAAFAVALWVVITH